jgi:hypothetical protein
MGGWADGWMDPVFVAASCNRKLCQTSRVPFGPKSTMCFTERLSRAPRRCPGSHPFANLPDVALSVTLQNVAIVVLHD